MFRMNELNSFQQEVNYQIERHGGLTPKAISELDEHTRKAYGSCLIELDENGEIPDATDIPEDCEDTKNAFYIKEYVKEYVSDEDDEDNVIEVAKWITRDDDGDAFGTQIHYVIKRPISIGETQIIDPVVMGTSVSRIRGN